MPLKGIMNPKIATSSSNQGWNNEKHKFNMPEWKDKAQLTNESFYQQFCFALGGFADLAYWIAQINQASIKWLWKASNATKMHYEP